MYRKKVNKGLLEQTGLTQVAFRQKKVRSVNKYASPGRSYTAFIVLRCMYCQGESVDMTALDLNKTI